MKKIGAENPIINFIIPDNLTGERFSSVIPTTNEKWKLFALGKDITTQKKSPAHLSLLSQRPENARLREQRNTNEPVPPMLDYVMRPEAGEDITVFVIDTGVNWEHKVRYIGPSVVVLDGKLIVLQEFKKSVSKNDWHIVPGDLTYEQVPGRPPPVGLDPDDLMRDAFNHGTCIASIIGGIQCGVAKKTHVMLNGGTE